MYNCIMRIFLFVINGLGVGSLPDYSKYESEYHNTSFNLEVLDKLETFKKLGLIKCCLEDNSGDTLGYYFRGRMLSNQTDFDNGMKEILGNVSFNGKEVEENLISFCAKKGIGCEFLSSKDNKYTDNVYISDQLLLEGIANINIEDNGLLISELNDFAKFGMVGEVEKAENNLIFIDSFFNDFFNARKLDDIVIITGNFGINLTKMGVTREYNPIFVYSKLANGNKNLKTIQGNFNITMTIVDLFDIFPNNDSFIDDKFKAKLDNFSMLLKNEMIANGIDKILEIKPVTKEKGEKLLDKSKIAKIRNKNN